MLKGLDSEMGALCRAEDLLVKHATKINSSNNLGYADYVAPRLFRPEDSQATQQSS